ncbi:MULTISPECIES: flagellar basal body L-ring protein FlgH [Bradyrhizobium]|uniref:Flagellar L-ring protein n=1 Tax=Bradyrhizobium yuanmingense TaxID=108015 RepID=A0A0R3BT10_9BRAD|nr:MULTISPECIES: flagellar basal body L-ring protein FlgH [Bradyrhizobium]KRP88342.1 flagellar biosynthesis protein FlgH [Bradyrhizobium yuanmingense]MCA1426432.1 flagellar basal body L-ring protein FlgH [Bradyrhizobium sp. NBAIM16]MCA1433169.1 flagellar basal body L-ring protein FlgH [Bradyrhizobium sp. BRP20]MCA1495572.1 flagellar basal body L-ring protein FlgH [Bradyrhizobium sp. NBAIM14]MCA1505217.1 flagellar basal body L-ring protein FlgH [Bradyrhizobium sp. NBAIM02]
MTKPILILSLLAASVLLAGCFHDPAEVLTGPQMSPVGSGLRMQADPIPVTPRMRTPVSYRSTWDDGTDLYRDPRARRTGDVVTVIISMQDKAKLDNKTGRSRDSQVKFGLDWLMDIAGWNDTGSANANLSTNTQIKGNGQIDRTEDIRLSIAAVVTDVLPNGNMMISGSQEFRVNTEMRVLKVGGIVRPRDISRANTISYDKIAEARVSYGGRGNLSDVQQPGWGHRIYDAVAPF